MNFKEILDLTEKINQDSFEDDIDDYLRKNDFEEQDELIFKFKDKYYKAWLEGLGTYVEYGNEEIGVVIQELDINIDEIKEKQLDIEYHRINRWIYEIEENIKELKNELNRQYKK